MTTIESNATQSATLAASIENAQTVNAPSTEQTAIVDASPVKTAVVVDTAEVQKEEVFHCPGHNEFFHHYSIYDKAKRKAQEAIDDLLENNSVESAHYQLIEKGTPIGDESGHFERLNSIYKYAVTLVYQHKDNSDECSFYQAFKK